MKGVGVFPLVKKARQASIIGIMQGYPDTSWELLINTMGVLIATSPVWLPLLLGYGLYSLWLAYIRTRMINSWEFVLLEVKLPKEIDKSPAAMELVLSAFWQSDEATNFIEKFWQGKVMPWFSLEMASFGGEVHFFVWGPKKFKNVMESRMYAQYPNLEIFEVPDYTQFVEFNPEENKIWATEYKLKKKDAYPIATYVDFGLDKDPKEEYKVDPITAMIEYLGSIRKEEQVWHQIIIRKHTARRGRKSFFKKNDWKEEVAEEVRKVKGKIAGDTGQKFEQLGGNITEQQKKVINAMERSTAKNAYEVGIRSVYIAPNDVFSQGPNISGLWGSFFQINTQDLNGLEGTRWTGFKYPWQDYKDIRKNKLRKRHLEAYKARGYFYPPYKKKYFIFNTEELATIYHFVGGTAQTPTFGRIGSRKAEPPTNLPV